MSFVRDLLAWRVIDTGPVVLEPGFLRRVCLETEEPRAARLMDYHEEWWMRPLLTDAMAGRLDFTFALREGARHIALEWRAYAAAFAREE